MSDEGVQSIGEGLPVAEKKAALIKQKTTPLPMFYCPSRHSPGLGSAFDVEPEAWNAARREARGQGHLGGTGGLPNSRLPDVPYPAQSSLF